MIDNKQIGQMNIAVKEYQDKVTEPLRRLRVATAEIKTRIERNTELLSEISENIKKCSQKLKDIKKRIEG